MNNKISSQRPLMFLLPLFVLLMTAQVASAVEQTWVASWIASASTLTPAPESEVSEKYQDQSLRMVLHTSAGGSQVRLRIANTHGNQMLKVAAANIALYDKDGSIVVKSARPVTFSQHPSIVIPRGATAISDAIEFEVPAMTNLAVSLYIAEASPSITRHMNANQRSWVAGGNQIASAAFVEAKVINSWDFVSSLEVLANDKPKVIAAVGDSITDGFLSTVDGNNRWPNYLSRRLAKESKQTFSVVNAGISGNRVLREGLPRFGENLLARLERDVFSIPGLSHIVLLEGINDIGMGARNPADKVSAEELIAGYRLVIAHAHARGVKIIGATLLPFQGAGYFSVDGEKTRLQVNQWIREGGEYDGVIDFEKATRDPELPGQILPAFTQDNLHPNDAGYEAMANSIDLNLFFN